MKSYQSQTTFDAVHALKPKPGANKQTKINANLGEKNYRKKYNVTAKYSRKRKTIQTE